MNETIRLKSGEKILLIEKLLGWNGDTEYYKVQRENGSINIIEKEELHALSRSESNHSKLSTPQKLKLFYSYFQGRPDVYATKWRSKAGKTGFSPHGEGNWIEKDGRFKKEIHTYYPYTLETVNDHIRAEKQDFKMGAGIYPLLENDKTKLIVFDFDDGDLTKEARAVVETCREYNIDVLIERSQSGKGLHLWLFFEEEILASTARYFGQLLLRLAMTRLGVVDFSSFDRMIPMQDTLPDKGFGNIIALPLRADKVEENKTVFLTDDFEVVDDFWQTLSDVSKYTTNEIETFIDTFQSNLPIQFYKEKNENLTIDLPTKLTIRKAGELCIEKKSISRKALIQLAHLATFHNPEFYKLQNMRAPTWEIEQFITAASEDKDFLYLPRGIKSKLKDLDTAIDFVNELTDGHPIEVSFTGELRGEQQQAIDEMMNTNMGIVSAPTGFGKTVVAANMIVQRKKSTLIIVHSRVLANQWKERLESFLDIDSEPFMEYTPTGRVRKKDKIGELHSGKESLSRNIDIALFQTLANREDLEDYLESYGMVIVDEVHHAAAKTFEDVLKKVKAKYLYGLTATPERKDGLTPLLFMRFGEIIYEKEFIETENPLIAKFFYPRFTNYTDLNPELGHQQHLTNMVDIDERNEQIVSDVVENIVENRTSLVLTERVAHANVLKERLENRLNEVSVFVLTSKLTEKENRLSVEKMTREKRAFVVIATSFKVGEGFDLPKLESIFFTMPFSWKGRTTQYIGRLHRGLEDKDELRVYDYVDIGVDYFARMYQKRMRVYNQLNYQLAEDSKTRENQTQLYDVNSYEEALQFDLAQAEKVVMGVVSVRQIQLDPFEQLRKNGTTIQLVIKEEKLKKHALVAEQLNKLNIRIIPTKVNPSSFIVCDGKLIWYGNILFGLKNKSEATALRLLNHQVAEKMLGQYLI